MTCRCAMCGAKNAGSNHIRKSYIAIGLGMDEDKCILSAKNKKHSHKVRRIRENREWKAEVHAA